MKAFLLISFTVFTAFVNSCSKSGDKLMQGTVAIRLHECEKGVIANDDLRLCFDSIITDSRCPANVVCVWSGVAIIKLSFTKNKETHSFDLSSLNNFQQYRKDTVISGYKFEFINLHPYPGTVSYPIPDSQRKAEIKITKQ